MSYLNKFLIEENYSQNKLWQNRVSYIQQDESVIYEPNPNPPFYVEALEELYISWKSSAYYSLDGINWKKFSVGQTPKIKKGERIAIRATGLTPEVNSGIGKISISGKCNIGGNIMSLLFGSNYANNSSLIGYDYAFCFLFYFQKIVDASKLILPTTLAPHCYDRMFTYCQDLVNAPALPDAVLKDSCYRYMFANCYSLTEAPPLRASVLANKCYELMFKECKNLQSIKMLATDITAEGCFDSWVDGVAINGTFVKAKGVTLPSGTSGIPSGWTVEEVEV